MAGILEALTPELLRLVPKSVIRKVATRYVAGESLEEAVEESKRLNECGCRVTIDLLGEAVTSKEEVQRSIEMYEQVLKAIQARSLDANISIKPTHFGLELGYQFFEQNLIHIVNQARSFKNFVRIDMEDSSTTDRTLKAFRKLREKGFSNTGVVLQAMLRRTLNDLHTLDDLSPSIRICKGVYREPEAIAYQAYAEVNQSYKDLLRIALSKRNYTIAIATHDDFVIEAAEKLISEYHLSPDQYEFQMLLGVRPEVREGLLSRGHRVRVYVPFGTSWYAYCIRRLKENPKFARFVTADVLKNPGMLFGDSKSSR